MGYRYWAICESGGQILNSPYLRGHNDQVFFIVHVAIVEHLLWGRDINVTVQMADTEVW